MRSVGGIIADLSDESSSLVSCFLKTKVLASKIQNLALLDWAEKELVGYSHDSEVPPYRAVPVNVIGTLRSYREIIQNTPVPLKHLSDELRNPLESVKFVQGIGSLAAMASAEHATSLSAVLSPEACAMICSNWPSDYILVEARKQIGISQVTEVLTRIRSKLLDFLLALDNRFDVEDNASTPEGKEIVSRLIQNTISGSHNVILVGDANMLSYTVHRGDWTSLEHALQDSGISAEDTKELRRAIEADGNFGDRVKGWFIEMCKKAAQGTWKVGLSVGSSLLSKYLEAYFGFALN